MRLLNFFKKETVLCIALLLAAGSAIAVPPDIEYAGYLDYRTLAVLFCLMCVMAGLQKMGLFNMIARKLLCKVNSSGQLVLILVLLCFFFSMLITNDVSLITFVPFTFTVLGLLGEEQKKGLLLPTVAMQTVAANLGSMLTPIGNPQNLYLYGKAGMTIGEFVELMMPYTIFSLLLLGGWCLLQGRGPARNGQVGEKISFPLDPAASLTGKGKELGVYLLLFLLCLSAVAQAVPWEFVLAIVLLAVVLLDRQVFARVDYSLLATFAGFFVFIGNMGRIPAFSRLLQRLIAGNEVFTAIAASQLISNVPAALLLSGFTQDYPGLIVGANLGGLGTLVASMASLISYKYVAKEESGSRGKYILLFTAANVVFLILLIALHLLLSFRG